METTCRPWRRSSIPQDRSCRHRRQAQCRRRSGSLSSRGAASRRSVCTPGENNPGQCFDHPFVSSSTFQSCLWDIRHSLAKHVHGDFITILVLPIGRFVPEFYTINTRYIFQGKIQYLFKLGENISPCPLHLAAWVGDHAGHDAADVVGQLVEVGHSGGVQQLVWNLIWMLYVFGKHMLQILRPSWDI